MRRLPLYLLAAASGCIWNPNNRTEREKGAALTLSGFTLEPSQQVRVRARDYDTGAAVQIASVVSNATEVYAGSGLYAWSATVTAAVSPNKYWAPTQIGPLSAGTSSNGRLELSAFLADNTRLATFSEAAEDCVNAEILGGETPVNAGAMCYDGTEVVQFDETGIANGADPNTWTVMPGAGGVAGSYSWKIVKYKSQGLDIYALVCQPGGAGPFPVHIHNHGGAGGLFPADLNLCLGFAAAGWVTAMSTYRGEPTYATPAGTFVSQGQVEVCLGEVTDTLRLLEVLDAQVAQADMERVLMTGFSHGGCITSRAVERGAPVQAAIDVFGPSDWALLYNECSGAFCTDIVKPLLEAVTGGTPGTKPMAYNWRSPRYHDTLSDIFAGDLGARDDVKFLIQQGTADTTVPVNQSCKLALDAWGSGSQRWHVLADGTTTTDPITGCTQSWNASDQPHLNWPDQRYLLVYQGAGHAFNAPMAEDFYRFIDSLGWATPFGF